MLAPLVRPRFPSRAKPPTPHEIDAARLSLHLSCLLRFRDPGRPFKASGRDPFAGAGRHGALLGLRCLRAVSGDAIERGLAGRGQHQTPVPADPARAAADSGCCPSPLHFVPAPPAAGSTDRRSTDPPLSEQAVDFDPPPAADSAAEYQTCWCQCWSSKAPMWSARSKTYPRPFARSRK